MFYLFSPLETSVNQKLDPPDVLFNNLTFILLLSFHYTFSEISQCYFLAIQLIFFNSVFFNCSYL